ncbi:MspA family porin [Gordonia sp. NB41Y]|uniref:MspA family porin n=1 Tax=Gordonia sp. NB41Y TaxID=875808 RepID=UPI00273C8700|nr:MspA family porin [Gordonia sp. NB41Y]WLP91867.1 MspA family porin [Gordonia sp. NB41Y]
MNKIITRRVAAGVGLAGAAVMGVSALGTGAAAAGPVAGTTITKTLVDGTPVKIQLFDQSVNYQKSIVESFNLVREVWVSGKVRVTVGGKAEGGTIAAGYIVGCQVNVGVSSDTEAGTGAGAELSSGGAITPSSETGGSAGASLSLGPGQAGTVWLINTTDSDDDSVNDYTFTGSQGGVAYSQETFKVSNCGGYAEAKAKVKVTVDTGSVKGIVTLYGKPFSLG